jgi:hypothetical protein
LKKKFCKIASPASYEKESWDKLLFSASYQLMSFARGGEMKLFLEMSVWQKKKSSSQQLMKLL